MKHMLNSDDLQGGNTMPNPFGGGAPFNPFMSTNNSNSSSSGGFNVDDLVKRIDAKIAELEEEERQEKAKLEQESVMQNNMVESESILINTPQVSPITVEENNTKNGITDDQFFDDFFFDE